MRRTRKLKFYNRLMLQWLLKVFQFAFLFSFLPASHQLWLAWIEGNRKMSEKFSTVGKTQTNDSHLHEIFTISVNFSSQQISLVLLFSFFFCFFFCWGGGMFIRTMKTLQCQFFFSLVKLQMFLEFCSQESMLFRFPRLSTVGCLNIREQA